MLWDGVDTATVDPDGLRRSVAVIFQDFLHYSCRPRTSAWAATSGSATPGHRAAVHAGADDFRPAAEGRAPEGGMRGWAGASGPRRPTAALDARAEHELFESIRTLCRGRSVLLISHRFSSVRSADRIYVLHGGRVVEAGSHDQLMGLGGRYAELFTLQASAYLAPESS